MASAEPRSQDFGAAETSDPTSATNSSNTSKDPFAAQRSDDNDPFAGQRDADTLGDLNQSPPTSPNNPQDRRMSKEWGTLFIRRIFFVLRRAYTENTPSIFADASKVVPSRFQKREGSIYATPGSRDAHTGQGKVRDQTFHDKLKQKGWM
ncbi:hypothetical protein MMC09_005110 [Bachmanniomyces sp. S44760]|nr:hypothetical protein [Bachmanniomyces sp. S44760]